MTILDGRKRGGPFRLRACIGVLALWGAAAVAADSAPPPASPAGPAAEPVFARVGDRTVSLRDYDNLYAATLRQKFYHGQVPEDQIAVVRQEVADTLIDHALLLDEAKRRGVTADQAKVKQAIDGYETRYSASPMWQQNRERLLPGLTAQIEQQSVLEQLESAVRTVAEPTSDEAKAYFLRNPEKFTEPEKLKLSIILLKVAPSSPKAAWDQAREEAAAIHRKLAQGADFGELARLHSADASGARGGGLDYLHRGMLPEALQGQVDQFKTGVAAEPITLLEGVAIFRLDERVPAKLRAFEDVRARAGELLRREQSETAWKALLAALRASTSVRIEAPGFSGSGAVGK